MFKRWAFGLAVLICWMPVQVFALGLGNIEMRSALNQALDARIELLRARAGELKDLSITLASADTFKRAGMDRPAFLTQLRFEVVTNPAGAPYIQVKSAQPITEPFLNFLIEVNWPNGRLLREFTVLVDPPVLTERAPGAVEAPVTQPAEQTTTARIDRSAAEAVAVAPVATGAIEVPVPPQRAKPSEPIPAVAAEPAVEPAVEPEQPTANERAVIEAEPVAPKTAPEVAKSRPRPRPTRVAPPKPVEEEAPAATVAEGGTEYAVKSNDTLWSIAAKVRPNSAVSVPQMMIALLQNNPEAFSGNNINNLKQGSVLRLSDVSAATSISKDEAMRITDLQWEQWKSSRGTTVGSAPSRTGRPKAVAPPAEARVKLVSPNISGEAAAGRNAPKAAATGGSRDPAQAKQELALEQESLDAQKRETQDMRERVAGLEEQVNTMQRLVQLKDDQLAALQNQAKGKKAEPAPAAESPVAAGGKTEAGKAAEPAADAAKPSGLMARLMSDPKLIGLAVVVAGIVVLLVWLVVRRRKMQQFQESILTLNDSVAEPGFAQNKAENEDASFMSDFSVSSMEGIQTEISEVDPLSEADVYLAYGRYKQAEELVSQAIEKNPQRAELKMKLLEIHYAAKDGDAFALQADLVRENFSAKQPEMWARVLEMGREVAPQNPLFGGAGGAPSGASPAASKAVDEFDLGDLNFNTGGSAGAADDSSLDFDLAGSGSKAKKGKPVALDETMMGADLELTLHDKKSGKTAAPTAAADEHSLDFDLSAFDEAEKASTAASGNKDEGLDFDFSAFEESKAPPAAAKAAASAANKDDGLDIDFGAGTPAVAQQSAAAKRDANVIDFNTSNTDDSADDHLLDQPDSEIALAEGGIDGEMDDALFADVDEIGTKLDLAKAYIDMGDSEGARSILDEVIEEGNDNQKQEAQVLMRQIA
jgi:pilus assembly protein FimV